MVVTMACLCVCMSSQSVKAAGYSVTGDFYISKGFTTTDNEGAYKQHIPAAAQIKPNNGAGAYRNYVSVYVVYKDNGNIRATNGLTCSSDELLYQSYLSTQTSTSRVYYLAASMAPSATANFGTFKYMLTP